MDACTCHLCGEAMEPDVVVMQGDTCEPCYLLHVIPIDLARRLDDGFSALQLVAAVAVEELQRSGVDEFQPLDAAKEAFKERRAQLKARASTPPKSAQPRYDEIFVQGSAWLAAQGADEPVNGDVIFPDDIGEA